MEFSKYFPIYEKLSKEEQDILSGSVQKRTVPKGTLLYKGDSTCLGFLVVTNGQFRAYIASDDGREITLYRLLERDVCLFSASCAMRNVQFEIMLYAEKDTEFFLIPADVYEQMSRTSLVLSNYTNDIMSEKMTEVMWLMEQIMWKSMDKRLAAFLLAEASLDATNKLEITHEKIAAHLGTAREVVTRLLKYFQNEGLVTLSRGAIEIINEDDLSILSK